jgi:hypothetical protein
VFRRKRTIPTADVRALRRARIRTGLVRVSLVVLACVLAGAAFLSARGLEPRSNEFVPGGRSGVVVLDVSLSIVTKDYARARGVLERLVESDNPMGLVVFSDVAYELYPPRTPAQELKPIMRYFTLNGDSLPPNPWTPSFQAGTRISSGLELAERMLRRDHVSPASIVLISDLETAPNDLGALGRTLTRLRKSPITLRVVPLSPTSDGLTFFGGLLGQGAFVNPVEPNAGEPRTIEVSLRGELPLGLVLASGLALLALAVYEGFAGQLGIPGGPGWTRQWREP